MLGDFLRFLFGMAKKAYNLYFEKRLCEFNLIIVLFSNALYFEKNKAGQDVNSLKREKTNNSFLGIFFDYCK